MNLLFYRETFEEIIDRLMDSGKYIHLKEKKNLWEKITEKIGKGIGENRPQPYMPSDLNPNNSQFLFFIVVGLILLIIIYRYLKSNKAIQREQKIIHGEILKEETSRESLFQKAIYYEKEGNFKDAVRLYFIAILFHMHEKSLCYLDDSKTNYEIMKHLSDKGFSKTKEFKKIGDYFYYIWYGNKEVDLSMFSWYKEGIKEISMEVKGYSEK
ncbi:MAG: hypothetical protein AB2421_14420 [Thermotaleaceae bacterium]